MNWAGDYATAPSRRGKEAGVEIKLRYDVPEIGVARSGSTCS